MTSSSDRSRALRLLVVLLLAAMALLGAGILLEDDGDPLVTEVATDHRATDPSRDPSPDVGMPDAAASRADSAVSNDDQAQDVRIESRTVFGVVELRAFVEHETGEVPAESFRWTAVGMTMGIEPRGFSEGRIARIRIPVDARAEVVVESDGCRRSDPIEISLRGAQSRAVEIRLRPRYERKRVTLRCRDELGGPVRRVAIRCECQPQDSEQRQAWQTLWTTDSAAIDGVHVLDVQLAERCRFHITPIDEARLPLRLLPVVLALRIQEGGRLDEEVVHAAGGTVALVWSEGEPTPGGLAGASIRLFDAEDREVVVNWHKGESNSSEFTIDYNAVPCHAANALPEGRYTVRVQGRDLDLAKAIEVRKGMATRVAFP